MKTLWRRQRATNSRTGERGQSLIELAIAMPVVLLLLLGMLEFGFAFSHHLTLEYATREGARTGAALAAGGTGPTDVPCAFNSAIPNVDDYIIAAVQRVLTGTTGQIPIAQVTEIRIYEADGSGADTTRSNKWIPAVNPDGTGAGTGASIDGVKLMFSRSGPTNWNPCARDNTAPADSVGVSLVYDYHYITPLGKFMGISGAAHLEISDRTVMALNPSGF